MKIVRNQIALLFALIVTILFGQMAWLAHAGAIDNPEPTQFEQLEVFWITLHWVAPALLIGIFCTRHIVVGAALAKFSASFILLGLKAQIFSQAAPMLPDPPGLLLSMVADVLSGIPLAIALVWAIAIASKKLFIRRSLFVMILVPVGIGAAWATPMYLSHKALLAQLAPEKAEAEAAHDIANGSMKIYRHGSFAAYAVGLEHGQHSLVENLPNADGGIGCVIADMEVFHAQGEYATRYNKTILKYLQSHPRNP